MDCPQCKIKMKYNQYRDHTERGGKISAHYYCPSCLYEMIWRRGERFYELGNMPDAEVDTEIYFNDDDLADLGFDNIVRGKDVILLDEAGRPDTEPHWSSYTGRWQA